MIINSLISIEEKLIPVELELTLIPGLPQIQILGLPDQAILESANRIKCALKKQGFDFPKAQKILVNLRPNHLRKNSKGIELAIAAAYLWETQQIPLPLDLEDTYIYGELALDGRVFEPEDLHGRVQISPGAKVMTGLTLNESSVHFTRESVRTLRDITKPRSVAPDGAGWIRPQDPLHLSYSKSQARIIELFAFHPVHLLLTGPTGSGKTTLAKNLTAFLKPPPPEMRGEWGGTGENWWPVIAPHASLTMHALLSGGRGKTASELSRCQNGFILLDELLEFRPEVLESLRGPLDGSELLISRVGYRKSQKSNFTCIATTNLCPCGDWTPALQLEMQTEKRCRFGPKKCFSYCERLSGPLVDRFQVMAVLKNSAQNSEQSSNDEFDEVLGSEILRKLDLARAHARERESKCDPDADGVGAEDQVFLGPALESRVQLVCGGSRRKRQSLLQMIKICCLLDLTFTARSHHFDEAYSLTVEPFDLLKKRPVQGRPLKDLDLPPPLTSKRF